MKKELEDWKQKYDHIVMTDTELDQVIEKGMKKARRQSRYKWWSILPMVSAAILFISAITMINTVPAFATQLSKMPGLERFVELVQFDKGQQSAIENDYFQVIDKTKTVGDLTLTLDGALRDENGIVLFYTVSSEKDIHRVRLENTKLTGAKGEKLKHYHQSERGVIEKDEARRYSQTMSMYTEEPISFEDFTFSAEVVGVESLDNGVGNQLREKIAIDFQAKDTKEAIHYQVDKTVHVENQLIYIDSVTIQPLRTTVKLHADPKNKMRTFSIDDIALIDETGEEWASIQSGIAASGTIEAEGYELYLQSNYFEQPEELTLTFSKVQAVDRDRDYFRFDLGNEEILHDPHNLFKNMEYENGWLSIEMNPLEDFYKDPFGKVYDVEGNNIKQEISNGSHTADGNTKIFSRSIQADQQIIDVKLTAYPHWIEEKVSIPLN